MVSQFFDRARKDFWEMFIHHIVTLLLLSFSWSSNLIRVGTLVLILHDVGDIFLEVRIFNKSNDSFGEV
jgi:ceramide synthetase